MTAINEMLHAPRRGPVEGQLDLLKEELLRPMLASISNNALVREIAWTANEAAALAWMTICPVLVLPTLLEEKVLDTMKRWEKQQRLRPSVKKEDAK
jgi:hypothetical protein